jgi:uncharacterized protein YegL
MGWAKYQEDIVSRYVSDRNLQRSRSPAAGSGTGNGQHQAKPREESKKMTSFSKFAVAAARPLPVLVLADTSGSMSEGGKIQALNAALKDMVKSFARESRLRAEIQVGLITFGGAASLQLPLAAAQAIAKVEDLAAAGKTPLGSALNLARELLEDSERIPSRAYRPVLILLSDGRPTDDWKVPFEALCRSERASKASRLAMAIGADADETLLKSFANDPAAPLFKAHNARDIQQFFRAVTMSVAARAASQNPDLSAAFELPSASEDDDLDLDFK